MDENNAAKGADFSKKTEYGAVSATFQGQTLPNTKKVAGFSRFAPDATPGTFTLVKKDTAVTPVDSASLFNRDKNRVPEKINVDGIRKSKSIDVEIQKKIEEAEKAIEFASHLKAIQQLSADFDNYRLRILKVIDSDLISEDKKIVYEIILTDFSNLLQDARDLDTFETKYDIAQPGNVTTTAEHSLSSTIVATVQQELEKVKEAANEAEALLVTKQNEKKEQGALLGDVVKLAAHFITLDTRITDLLTTNKPTELKIILDLQSQLIWLKNNPGQEVLTKEKITQLQQSLKKLEQYITQKESENHKEAKEVTSKELFTTITTLVERFTVAKTEVKNTDSENVISSLEELKKKAIENPNEETVKAFFDALTAFEVSVKESQTQQAPQKTEITTETGLVEKNPIHVANVKQKQNLWHIKKNNSWVKMTAQEFVVWQNVLGALREYENYIRSATNGPGYEAFTQAANTISNSYLENKKRELILEYQTNPESSKIETLTKELHEQVDEANSIRKEIQTRNIELLNQGALVTDDTVDFAFIKDPYTNPRVIARPEKAEKGAAGDWKLLGEEDLKAFEKARDAVQKFKIAHKKSQALTAAKNNIIQLVNEYRFNDAKIAAEKFSATFTELSETEDTAPTEETTPSPEIATSTIETPVEKIVTSEPEEQVIPTKTVEDSAPRKTETLEQTQNTSLRLTNWPDDYFVFKTRKFYEDPKNKERVTRTENTCIFYEQGGKRTGEAGVQVEPYEQWDSIYRQFKKLYQQELLPFFTKGTSEIIREKKELYKDVITLENEVIAHIKRADADVEELLAQLENSTELMKSDWDERQKKRREELTSNKETLSKKEEEQKKLTQELEPQNKILEQLESLYQIILPYITSPYETSLFSRKLGELREMAEVLTEDAETKNLKREELDEYIAELSQVKKLLNQTEAKINKIFGQEVLNKIHGRDVLQGVLRNSVPRRRGVLPTDKISTKNGSIMTVAEWEKKQQVEQEQKQDGVKRRLEETRSAIFDRQRTLFATNRKDFLRIYGPGVPRVKTKTEDEDINYSVAQVIIDEEKDRLTQELEASKKEFADLAKLIEAGDSSVQDRYNAVVEKNRNLIEELRPLTTVSDGERLRQLSLEQKSTSTTRQTFSPTMRDTAKNKTTFWQRFVGDVPKNQNDSIVEQHKQDTSKLAHMSKEDLASYTPETVNLAETTRVNMKDGMVAGGKVVPTQGTQPTSQEKSVTKEPVQESTTTPEQKNKRVEAVKNLSEIVAKFPTIVKNKTWQAVLKTTLGIVLGIAASHTAFGATASQTEQGGKRVRTLEEIARSISLKEEFRGNEDVQSLLKELEENSINFQGVLARFAPSVTISKDNPETLANVRAMKPETLLTSSEHPYGLNEETRKQLCDLVTRYRTLLTFTRTPDNANTLEELDTLARQAIERYNRLRNA